MNIQEAAVFSGRVLVATAVLVATGALGGCNRSPDSHVVSTPQPATPAAEATPVGTTPGSTTDGKGPKAHVALTFRVYQEDTTTGVAAEVDRMDDTGATHFVANVDDSGVTTLNRPCSAGERFQAQPKVPAFLHVAPQACAATVTFRLYSAQATYELIKVADNYSKAGDLANAQAYFGFAAERLKYDQPEEAARLRALATVAAGRVLGVDNAVTVANGKARVTDEFTNKLKIYQHTGKLQETGVLDAATQNKLARTPPAEVLQQVIRQPSATAEPAPPIANITSSVTLAHLREVPLSAAATQHAAVIRKSLETPK